MYVGGVFNGVDVIAANYSAVYDLASDTWSTVTHGVSVGTDSVCIINLEPVPPLPVNGNCSLDTNKPSPAAPWYCCSDVRSDITACVQPVRVPSLVASTGTSRTDFIC